MPCYLASLIQFPLCQMSLVRVPACLQEVSRTVSDMWGMELILGFAAVTSCCGVIGMTQRNQGESCSLKHPASLEQGRGTL